MLKRVLLLVICMLVLLAPVCFAEKPLGEFTKEQAIEKLFTGRTLDPIEGFWYTRFFATKTFSGYATGMREIMITKTSLLKIEKPQDRDFEYTVIQTGNKKPSNYGPEKYEVIYRINKTKYPNWYEGKDKYGDIATFLILNPTTIVVLEDDNTHYVRTYPELPQ